MLNDCFVQLCTPW